MKGKGVRLRNVSSVECYVNTAVNNIVTNDDLMLEIRKSNPLMNWIKTVLKDHKPGFLESHLTNTYGELVMELDTCFSSSQGCTEMHGVLCFNSRKKEYTKNRENLSVLEELNKMVCRKNEIQDVLYLKELLKKHFGMFGSNTQQDAQDAYLSILECAPDTHEVCNLNIRATRKCIKCERVSVKNEENGLMDLNYMNYDSKLRTLQEAVDEYSNRRGELIMKCPCTIIHLGGPSEAEQESNTTHTETWEVVKCPKVLLIKVKGRERPKDNIKFAENFTLKGVSYVFQSAMLYTGSGQRGHGDVW